MHNQRNWYKASLLFSESDVGIWQQDSTASSMISELKTLVNQKEFQLEKQDRLIRDQAERIETLEQSLNILKLDLELSKNEAYRSCESKLKTV